MEEKDRTKLFKSDIQELKKIAHELEPTRNYENAGIAEAVRELIKWWKKLKKE